MKLSNLQTEHFYGIAKIIDNDYIGSQDTLSVKKKSKDGETYFSIDSNKCDSASLIRLYVEEQNLSRITRLGADVDTWVDVQKSTFEKVTNYLIDIQS